MTHRRLVSEGSTTTGAHASSAVVSAFNFILHNELDLTKSPIITRTSSRRAKESNIKTAPNKVRKRVRFDGDYTEKSYTTENKLNKGSTVKRKQTKWTEEVNCYGLMMAPNKKSFSDRFVSFIFYATG
jgi:hypothetical protein